MYTHTRIFSLAPSSHLLLLVLHLLLELVVVAFLFGADAFGLVPEPHSVVRLHLLNGLLLVLLQSLQLRVVVLLLRLGGAEKEIEHLHHQTITIFLS